MPISRKKLDALSEQQVIMLDEFSQVRTAILAMARQFNPNEVSRVFLGSWTILDLLAHLRGWDFTNLQAAQDILNGKLPDFYGQFDKDWASYNAKLITLYKEDTLEAMLAAVAESHASLIQYLFALSPEELFTDQGVRHGNYKVIISRLIEAEKRDERKHLEQIENFIRSHSK